jgi:NAD+ synthase
MNSAGAVCLDLLRIDAPAECTRIEGAVRAQLKRLHRRGVVLGLSGGIDSSVVAALAVRAIGRERVAGLLMPELESSDDSLKYGQLLAQSLGIPAIVESIGPILQAAGCYARRDEAIRALVPDYGPNWRCKLVLADVTAGARFAVTSLVVEAPDGRQAKVRLTGSAYNQIVAASNFKQRTRKMLEYYHADRLQYAVAGTPNRLEYDQGFFVKNGDGAADLKPIAHLYKSQVYQLAAYLDVPAEIRRRPSTTDTFSLPQSQEEFYFSLPLEKMDLCLYGHNRRIPAEIVARAAGMSSEQVKAAFAAIESKRRATSYQHSQPLLVEPVFADTSTAPE